MLMDQTFLQVKLLTEDQEKVIPVSFSQGTNWEALVFAQDYSTRRNHVNEEIESLLTHSKYMHARL